MKEPSLATFTFLIILFLNLPSLTGQCVSESGRSKLMPLGNHLMGLQQSEDSLQLAIMATEYLCLEQGDQSNIEFTDGSFIYLANLLELNCDGKAFFGLSQSDRQQLTTKSISKVVLGSRYEGYTKTTTPTSLEAQDFLTLMKCVSSATTLSSVPSATILETTVTQSVPQTNTSESGSEVSPQTVNEVTESNVTIQSSVPSNLAPEISTIQPESPSNITNSGNEVHSQATNVITETNVTSYTEPVVLPLRSVQFIATSGGKIFSELTYLGRVISQQVGNQNVFRYKIQGNFSDADVQYVIESLAIHGYKGAFEVQ